MGRLIQNAQIFASHNVKSGGSGNNEFGMSYLSYNWVNEVK